MGKGTDLWDDSALVNAFNSAITKYKMMHSKAYNDNSSKREQVISSTAENASDLVDESHEATRQVEVHDDKNVVSNTATDMGEANDLPPSQESHHSDLHASEPYMQMSNATHIQKADDGFSYSQDVEYNQLLNRYYELEEQRQKVLQQLQQVGYWNYQCTSEGSGTSAQWGTCSTSQEQHQVLTHQSSCPGVLSSCCPYTCPCLVAPCPSIPACASCGTCVSKIGTDVTATTFTMGPGKLSSLENDNVIKTAMGAAERAISSMKMKKSSTSNIHEAGDKERKECSSLSEGEMAGSASSETDLSTVLSAWYSAGFYTGKYLVEQSITKGRQG